MGTSNILLGRGGGAGDGLVSYPEGSSNTLRNAEDTGISSGYLDLWLMCAFFLHHTCKQLTAKVQRHPVQKRYSVQDTAYPIYKTQDPVNLYTLFGRFFRLIQGVPPRCKECICNVLLLLWTSVMSLSVHSIIIRSGEAFHLIFVFIIHSSKS